MFKNLILILIIVLMLPACKSVKDGLSGAKQDNSDEFLVIKKSPLVVPPDFEKLPKPGEDIDEVENEKIAIQDIISSDTSTTKEIKSENQSIEKFILEKIIKD